MPDEQLEPNVLIRAECLQMAIDYAARAEIAKLVHPDDAGLYIIQLSEELRKYIHTGTIPSGD